MQLDKSQVVDFVRSKLGDERAAQAEQMLPDRIDTDSPEFRNLLQRFNIDPQALMSRFKIPGIG